MIKLLKILEESAPVYKVERLTIAMSQYSTLADKIVKALVNTYVAEMKSLKGKWNGREFQFRNEENFKVALRKRDDFQNEYVNICKKYPPGNTDNSIDTYFKHLKTSGNPMYRK